MSMISTRNLCPKKMHCICGRGKAEYWKRWAEKIHVAPQQVRVQRMKNKWASCSTQGWICFSEDLLLQPRRFQEYAIIHELLHLQVPNHGKLFKSLLCAYVPDWKKVVQDIQERTL